MVFTQEEASLTNIASMIEKSFENGIVNFKLMQAILLILARTLRLVERRIVVAVTTDSVTSVTSMTISEVKLIGKHEDHPHKETYKGKSEKADQGKVPTAKLLIVRTETDSGNEGPLSIVTREQFAHVWQAVVKLQERFGSIDVPGFTENKALYETMTLPQDISDPKAILQLSARLEHIEKSVSDMTLLLLDLIHRQELSKGIQVPPGAELNVAAQVPSKHEAHAAHHPATAAHQPAAAAQKLAAPAPAAAQPDGNQTVIKGASSGVILAILFKGLLHGGKTTAVERSVLQSVPDYLIGLPIPSSTITETSDGPSEKREKKRVDPLANVTFEELSNRVQRTKRALTDTCDLPLLRVEVISDKIIEKMTPVGPKLDPVLIAPQMIKVLEEKIKEIAMKVTTFDLEISGALTNTQEEMTSMQRDLETAIDFMDEALAHRKPDTEGIAELNQKFDRFNRKTLDASDVQEMLYEDENDFGALLQDVIKAGRMLSEKKADRDKIKGALSSKASVALLNDYLQKLHFDAVMGDLQKSLVSAVDKFNATEVYWQKGIDDLTRVCNEKAKQIQIEAVKNDIKKHTCALNERLDYLLSIAGLNRGDDEISRCMMIKKEACISCGMKIHEPVVKKSTKRSSVSLSSSGSGEPCIGTTVPVSKSDVGEDERPSELGDGDREICYPNYKVPQRILQQKGARVCGKICGTRKKIKAKARVDDKDILSTLEVKALKKEDQIKQKERVPCKPCNLSEQGSSRRSVVSLKTQYSVVTKQLEEKVEEVSVLAGVPSRAWEEEIVEEEETVSEELTTIESETSLSSFEDF